jgi:hypothetical protein
MLNVYWWYAVTDKRVLVDFAQVTAKASLCSAAQGIHYRHWV